LKHKIAIKFEEKAIKKQKSAKTSPKNKQISVKTSPKTSNPQVFKKPATSKKTSPNSRENHKVGNTDG